MITLLRKYPLYKWILAAADFVVLNVAFAVALRLRYAPYIDVINIRALTVTQEVLQFAVYSLLWIFMFEWLDLYKRQVVFTGPRQIVAIVRGQWLGLVGLVVIQFFFHPFSVTLESRLMFLYFILLSSLGLIAYRISIVRRLFRSRFYNRFVVERALIIGGSERAQTLVGKLCHSDGFKVEILGFLSKDIAVGTEVAEGAKVLGSLEEIEELVKTTGANSVYIAESIEPVERLLTIIEWLSDMNLQVHVNVGLFSVLPEKVSVDSIADYPLVRMSSSDSHVVFRLMKRGLDIMGALAGIVVLSPLFLYIACKVKRSSPGPVIFRQTRIGLRGEEFRLYKFRTMTLGSDDDEDRKKRYLDAIAVAETQHDGLSKIVNESRITECGIWLRKHSLDELPQLFNVLFGDMSLVGPRPCLPYEKDAYRDWHRRRLSVRPGCTGLWQVVGRSETSHEDMVILDLYYIQNMSPWFDLQLILKTLPVMLTGQGGG